MHEEEEPEIRGGEGSEELAAADMFGTASMASVAQEAELAVQAPPQQMLEQPQQGYQQADTETRRTHDREYDHAIAHHYQPPSFSMGYGAGYATGYTSGYVQQPTAAVMQQPMVAVVQQPMVAVATGYTGGYTGGYVQQPAVAVATGYVQQAPVGMMTPQMPASMAFRQARGYVASQFSTAPLPPPQVLREGNIGPLVPLVPGANATPSPRGYR